MRHQYTSGGEVLDETDLSGNLTSEYVFFGGARIARRDASGNVFYYLADHLGSSRVMAEIPSGQTTATLCYDADFYPFGGERAYTNSCQQNYKFTGKERDPESGLDNFEARFYGSSIARFTSPDDPFVGWNLADPQSLNLYAYVQDNPINDVDPTGHCHIGNGEYTPCTFDTIDSALSGDVPIVGLSNWYPGGVSGPDTVGNARANNLEAGEQQYVHNTVEGGGWTTSTSSSYSTVHVGDNGNLVGEDYTHMTITAHDPPAWADASIGGAIPWALSGAADDVLPYLLRLAKFGTAAAAVLDLTLLAPSTARDEDMLPPVQFSKGGSNQKENEEFREAVKRIERDFGRKLTRDEIRRLHDEISGKGFGLDEIVETGKALISP